MHVRAADDPESGNDPATAAPASDQPPGYDTVQPPSADHPAGHKAADDVAQAAFVIGALPLCLIIMAVELLPIAMIVMGGIHINNCPRQKMIPIYLIVSGSASILSGLCNAARQRSKQKTKEIQKQMKLGFGCEGMLDLFIFCWFIAGHIWIFGTYNDFSTNPEDSDYCHPTLYNFAFWAILASYMLICIMMVVACCLACWMAKKKRDHVGAIRQEEVVTTDEHGHIKTTQITTVEV